MFIHQRHSPRFLLELVGVGSHLCASNGGRCGTVVGGGLAPMGRMVSGITYSFGRRGSMEKCSHA